MKQSKLMLVLLLLLQSVLPVSAGPVDANRAGEVAKAFFKNDPNPAHRMSAVRQVDLYGAPLTKAGDSNPAFRVFNRDGGGFVIVAGDDACKPILGYSFESCFEGFNQMPEGLRDWLADFEAQVKMVRSAQVSPEALAAAREAWLAVEVPTKAGNDYKSEINHNTPAWSQGAPYNRLCPTDNGKPSYVGCVPLAMGLVMNFFGYPTQGKGTLPTYDYTYHGRSFHIEGHALNYAYEWSKFRTVDFNKGYTEDQINALATLLRDVAMAGQAWFSSDDTDCNFERIVPGVIEYFGYDPNVTHLKRWYFTDAEWMDMIKGDLQDHPLLYAANQESGGHAFVVDGYDKKDNLHINWGWGPKYNGYFALSAFTPASGMNFKYEHTTVLGLVPDQGKGGSPEEYLFIGSAGGSDGKMYHGLSCSDVPERGKTFTTDVAWFFNGGIGNFSGKICMALTDSEGNIVETISSEQPVKDLQPRAGSGYFGIQCKINAYPMEGDRVRLIYRSNKWPAGQWKVPLYRRDDGTIESIAVKADTSKLEEMTSLSFSHSSGIEMKTKDRVAWSLKGASGSVVAEGVSSDCKISIPETGLAVDSYTLTLSRGKEKQVVTIKMGSK